MSSVFISYRRQDTEGQARALFQDLSNRLGRDAVFMDVDSIDLGRDFRVVLQERLASCDLVLVLIGPDWLDSRNAQGRRRLDEPADVVRQEIAAALKRNIPITPLLVRGAAMPTAEQLPADIADLAFRNGFELSHNRWESDVQELLKRLGLAVAGASAAAGNAAAPHPAPVEPPRRAGTLWPWAAGVAGALTLATLVYFGTRGAPDRKGPADTPPVAAAPAAKAGPAVAPKAAADATQGRTRLFEGPAWQLKIDNPEHFRFNAFEVDRLDPERDFRIEFRVQSTREGGSTRYGIAWNFTAEDYMLFTLHSTGGGHYSIGPGRSRTMAPFSRLSEGAVAIRGESGVDTLELSRTGTVLAFAVNGQEVWRTQDLRVASNRFALWVADRSEARIHSLTLHQ